MTRPTDYPFLVLVVSFFVMSLTVRIAAGPLRRWLKPKGDIGEDFNVIRGAALTLLTLIIGFSYSMATARYDQRKNFEEGEANAIGTEYVRADLLPAAEATTRVRTLLRTYIEQRILLYTTRDERLCQQIDARTLQLQSEMWVAVVGSVGKSPTPVQALAVSGMNDVLNSQGYAQASWWNRIPLAAWVLMATIAVFCHVLVGFRAQNARAERLLLLVLPLLVAISFFLIADIDSPRGGLIRVHPENLQQFAASLRAHDRQQQIQ